MSAEMPKMQREFEEHIRTLFDPATVEEHLYCDENGYYDRYATMLAWSAWQEATRQAMEPYNELLMAVGRKYTGETRHQTALRYIQQADRSALSDMPAQEVGK